MVSRRYSRTRGGNVEEEICRERAVHSLNVGRDPKGEQVRGPAPMISRT